MATDSAWLQSFLRHRHSYEIALWLLLGTISALANSATVTIELRRHDHDTSWLEPLIWESTSIVVLLALIPAQLAVDRKFPFGVDTWRRSLVWHAVATVPYSLLHVIAMVALRQLVYAAMGSSYDFGPWPRELWYEYLKDARTYALMLSIVYLYRSALLRLQGEVRLLTAPDAGQPLDAIDRPERFLVRKFGSEFLVAAQEIEWLEASENYVNLHVRGRVYPLRSTMNAIQERLDPTRFVRVHRSHIVNLDYLAQIEPLDSGDALLLLKNGARVACSRRYRGALAHR